MAMKTRWFVPLFILVFAAAAVAQVAPQVVTDPSAAFISGSIVVKGEGAAPSDRSLSAAQKRILALRAAKVMALREVAEVVDGVAVSGETRVVDAAAQSDVVRTTVQGLVKGAQVVNENYDALSEMGIVYVSVPLRGPNGIFATLMPQVSAMAPPLLPYAPAPGVQQAEGAYDGLILDVREKPFRPALINRVLAANGAVIYEPSRVAQEILVERGAAEYTNDVGKARALLGERGAANPLVVKAGGVVKSTDVEVSPADANAIFASNQRMNYLEGAKVVFVLR
jgi:hypothetical protein